jgi:hypothetical protein
MTTASSRSGGETSDPRSTASSRSGGETSDPRGTASSRSSGETSDPRITASREPRAGITQRMCPSASRARPNG